MTRTKLPILLVGEEKLALAALHQQLLKNAAYHLETEVHSLADAQEAVCAYHDPALVIVDLSRDADHALRVAEEIKQAAPHSHLLVTALEKNPDLIVRAMRAGAEEFLSQPFNGTELSDAFDRIRDKVIRDTPSPTAQGHIVTLCSSKGGAGTTTVATNLAITLASRHRSVCLVDLALQFGSVATLLNVDATYTICDFVKNIDRLDPLLLEGALIKHESGVRLLADPAHAEEASLIQAADVTRLLDTLVRSFDVVIVDTPKELHDTTLPALEKADVMLFVMETTVPSLKNARRAFEFYEWGHIATHKIQVVLNRYTKNKLMNVETVEKILDAKVCATIPNDYTTAITAANQGIAIREVDARSKLAQSYERLADTVSTHLFPTLNRVREPESKTASTFGRFLNGLGL